MSRVFHSPVPGDTHDRAPSSEAIYRTHLHTPSRGMGPGSAGGTWPQGRTWFSFVHQTMRPGAVAPWAVGSYPRTSLHGPTQTQVCNSRGTHGEAHYKAPRLQLLKMSAGEAAPFNHLTQPELSTPGTPGLEVNDRPNLPQHSHTTTLHRPEGRGPAARGVRDPKGVPGPPLCTRRCGQGLWPRGSLALIPGPPSKVPHNRVTVAPFV